VPLVQPYFTDPVDEATLVTAINDVIASVKNGAYYSYSYILGATSDACEGHMRNPHVVAHADGFITKSTKPPFTDKCGLCL
jgi:hypothetical protein